MDEAKIRAELATIHQRLSAGPNPFQHAGLYAAQQALCWVLDPEHTQSPFLTVTGAEPPRASLLPPVSAV